VVVVVVACVVLVSPEEALASPVEVAPADASDLPDAVEPEPSVAAAPAPEPADGSLAATGSDGAAAATGAAPGAPWTAAARRCSAVIAAHCAAVVPPAVLIISAVASADRVATAASCGHVRRMPLSDEIIDP
jgi:hypothetical protein